MVLCNSGNIDQNYSTYVGGYILLRYVQSKKKYALEKTNNIGKLTIFGI